MNEKIIHRGALPKSTHVQEFEFQQVLGHGGFGITYKGWNTILEMTVAIKEYMPTDIAIRGSDRSVQPKSGDDEKDFHWGLDRFLDEARMLARFDHPGIVRVQQFFEAHGTAYIVMEHLKGPTLHALYKDGKVSNEQQIRNLLEPILDALEQIHDAEFLHRDIKPSNIMFRQGSIPVLIDFGAARAALAMRSQTVTSIVTPGFSPIEQYSASAESRQGPWTDIYAVGAVLYQGMTGVIPSDATARVMDDGLVPVTEAVVGQYSDSLINAVDWALQIRGSDRPQSVGKWRGVLDGGVYFPKGVASSIPVKTAPSLYKTPLSGKMKWLIVIGLVTVLAVGNFAYWWDELVKLGVVLFDKSSPSNLDHPERSLLDGIVRVRALIGEGETAAARAFLEEVVEMGLDEDRRAALEAEIVERERQVRAAEMARLVNECEDHFELDRLAESLSCYQKVLEFDGDHEVASERIRRIGSIMVWKRVDNEKTVEGYYGFERDYPESPLARLARLKLDALEEEYWQSVRESGDESKYRRYLQIYPAGRFKADALSRISGEG